jgi:RNA polymerase sigma-70 factor (sigma-E family)
MHASASPVRRGPAWGWALAVLRCGLLAGSGGQPNAAGMSALGVRHALRGSGRDGKGGPGRAQLGPAPGGPAVDLTAIFRQHYPELVRLAVMLVGDRPTAEDVVQDVFATLHARRDRPGPRGDQLAYVRACVLNGCRSALRRRAGLSRIGGSAAPVPDLPHESAEHEAIQAEGRRQVLAALATLPRRRREVLVLRYYLGLREAEIAAVLGITPGTVKSTTARGLGALARALGEES